MTRLIILTLLAVTAGGIQAQDVPPAWPLDLDTRYLTGNFMEPRGGRFHTGLDIKTNSRTGYAVVAVRAGYISRVKVAPGGYGKAIYLRGDDGLTYVYGHLGRLADDLRLQVRDRQEHRGAYTLDLAFDPGERPVARGEILALSGQTGTTGPHLHFEVRAADGSPLDPLAHGFAVADTLAPEILAVRAMVPGADAGTSTLHWGDGKAPLNGRVPDLFLSHGAVRFSARIVERSDHLRYRLGAWRVRLFLDDREVFASRNDQLHWPRNRQQRLEYLRTPLGQERWLWRDGRVTLAGRAPATGFGDDDLAPGRHLLRLEAEDRSGNRSSVIWVVDVDPQLTGDMDPGWQDDGFTYPGPWLVEDAGVPTGNDAGVQWRRGALEELASPRWLRLAGLEVVDGPVQFQVGEQVLLDAVVTPWPVADESRPPAQGDSALGVYRHAKTKWHYETDLIDGAGGAAFSLDRPGIYGILRDVAGPIIAVAPVKTTLERQPARIEHGIAMPRWPVVRVPVGDHGSGVDWGTLAVSLDGASLVVEPDPPRDRILVEVPDRFPAGRHTLTIEVADRAGHRSEAALTLDLRESPSP